MHPSKVVAALAFLGLVPASIWVAHLGYDYGLYPYLAIPIAFGVLVAGALVVLFLTLPVLRQGIE